MDFGVGNKTALVLGAGGGLGGAVANSLAREGVRVAVADIDGAAAERTAAEITAAGGQARALAWGSWSRRKTWRSLAVRRSARCRLIVVRPTPPLGE